jgi:small subunit ribosomal protein S16
MGAKKRAFYRIVAADSRRARDGRFLEILGTYNPIPKPAQVTVLEDKLTKWLDQGAKPSDTVNSILAQIGFTKKYEKYKRGEDVSEITLQTSIKERRKKTKKIRKATVEATTEAPAETPPETPAETQTEAPAETPKEKTPSEGNAESPSDS